MVIENLIQKDWREVGTGNSEADREVCPPTTVDASSPHCEFDPNLIFFISNTKIKRN